MVKKIPMAICYDFDGTLSPGNMQEYEFMDKLGVKAMWFWKKSLKFSKTQNALPVVKKSLRKNKNDEVTLLCSMPSHETTKIIPPKPGSSSPFTAIYVTMALKARLSKVKPTKGGRACAGFLRE